MKEIPLTQGKYAIVDDEDYDFLSQWKWQYHHHVGKNTGYAVRSERGKSFHRKQLRMHRLILNCPNDKQIDHVNGNGVDNRKVNLRICTNQQNAFNRIRKVAASGYRGVYFNKKCKKWFASIQFNGKQYRIGWFATTHQAALAYDLWADYLHGEFARLNFIKAA